MPSKLLEVLHKGLKILENWVSEKKRALQAQLTEKKSISSEDEQWLDHEANLVDEQQILEALEDALDYEQGFARLDGEQKGIVRKLQEAAGDLSKAVGKKWKRASIFLLFVAETLADQPQAQNTHAKNQTRKRTALCQFSPRRRTRH